MKVISTDSHIQEPADLWTKRMSAAKWGERIPHVVAEERADYWYIDGKRGGTMMAATQVGVRFEDQHKLVMVGRQADVRRGGYDPVARMKDMDADGIVGEITFPGVGLSLGRMAPSEFRTAMADAYVDWLANEFCAAYPKRLKAVVPIDVRDIEAAIGEMRRAKKLGLGVTLSAYPGEERSYDQPMYDPLWAAAVDLEMPLHLHVATELQQMPSSKLFRDENGRNMAALASKSYVIQISLASMIMSGVFERFPKLKVVSVEYELSWAPYLLMNMDYVYTQKIPRPQWPRFKDASLPSDFFHRNVLVSFQEDRFGVEMRHHIGVENIMWGNDYPHVESTFPKSQEILNRVLAGVSEDEREKITWKNAAKLYGFSIEKKNE